MYTKSTKLKRLVYRMCCVWCPMVFQWCVVANGFQRNLHITAVICQPCEFIVRVTQLSWLKKGRLGPPANCLWQRHTQDGWKYTTGSLGRQNDFTNSSQAVAVQFCVLSIYLLDVKAKGWNVGGEVLPEGKCSLMAQLSTWSVALPPFLVKRTTWYLPSFTAILLSCTMMSTVPMLNMTPILPCSWKYNKDEHGFSLANKIYTI